MRKNISDCHPSFSLENVTGSSNYKAINSCSSLDLAYQLTAMTRREYSRDCHVASLLAMTAILFSFNAHATCTPTPDCATIGYTETSCENKSVKCPFDTSKLFCVPCDSSFQYLCNNTNEYGLGNSCGGKYQFCCNTSCSVGSIYYADRSCNSCLDNSKTAIGIVVKDNELITSLNIPDMKWSSGYIDVTGITNFENSTDVQNDIDGQSNTNAIIAQYGDTIDTYTNAGVFCYTYTPIGLENSKNKWYLPSAGEIYSYIASNYQKIKTGWNITGIEIIDNYFWSSSESGLYGAWIVDIENMNLIRNAGTKHYSHSVTCFMKI